MSRTVDDYRKSARCEGCRLPPGLCICPGLPRISLPVHLLLIRHAHERHRQSNTGHFVHRVFTNSQVRDYEDIMRPGDATPLWDAEADHRVLFPQADATVVSPDDFARCCRPALVILDGNWRQARRMSRRVPGIRSFPFVTLPDEPARWTMRRPRRFGQLSTGEAVGRALGLLGYEDEAREFLEVFEAFVSRVLHVRGRIPRREVHALP